MEPTQGTGGEVANALVCKTSIRGFDSRPVLHNENPALPQLDWARQGQTLKVQKCAFWSTLSIRYDRALNVLQKCLIKNESGA